MTPAVPDVPAAPDAPVRGPAPDGRAPARARRTDPERRARIVEACVAVIAERGVDGTSVRRVAAAADVPLGSMTYHFTGRDELLRAAFARVADETADRFAARLEQVAPGDREGGVRAVTDIVLLDVFPTARELVLTHELYTLAARDAGYRTLTNAWMRRSRAALERCFDPTTARVLDALIEGLTIHRALDTEPAPDSDVELAVRRVAGAGGDAAG